MERKVIVNSKSNITTDYGMLVVDSKKHGVTQFKPEFFELDPKKQTKILKDWVLILENLIKHPIDLR